MQWPAHAQPIATLTVDRGATLSGGFLCGHLSVNEDGELTEIGAPDDGRKAASLEAAKADDRHLSFVVDDGEDRMKLEMVITVRGARRTALLDVPHKIKPIRFECR